MKSERNKNVIELTLTSPTIASPTRTIRPDNTHHCIIHSPVTHPSDHIPLHRPPLHQPFLHHPPLHHLSSDHPPLHHLSTLSTFTSPNLHHRPSHHPPLHHTHHLITNPPILPRITNPRVVHPLLWVRMSYNVQSRYRYTIVHISTLSDIDFFTDYCCFNHFM